MGHKKLITKKELSFILGHLTSKSTSVNWDLLYTTTKKESTPTFALTKFEFDPLTRNAKMEITQRQEYRTIERYVTKNYVKTPIYSWWKTKTKVIKKTIKLSNSALESLNNHPDYIIKGMADQIIASLKNVDMLPSWFLKKWVLFFRDKQISEFSSKLKNEIYPKRNKIKNLRSKIKSVEKDILSLKLQLAPYYVAIKKNEEKIIKISNSKKSIFKSVFTIFIYNYLISNYRKQRLVRLKKKYANIVINFAKKIIDNYKQVENITKEILETNFDIQEQENLFNKKKQAIFKEYEDKLLLITKLPTEISNSDQDFIPLKETLGLEYQKIIGCYIIKNVENSKCYVGQSKDIYKRLKQHFHGTVPKNSIFAEDYYLSKTENREDLFEVKIVPCQTKDELDKTERDLIFEYDSLNNGYNATSGNT